jgi:esterase/lipase superfamily enzyme
MERLITSWYSDRLKKEMPVAVYGYYGFSLLLIPTAAADFLEYERFQLIDALSPFINAAFHQCREAKSLFHQQY